MADDTLARYVFTFHTKVKWGLNVGVSFLIAHFVNDATAVTCAEYLEQNILPNNMKCTVSKTIRLAPNCELPRPADITDEFVGKFLMSCENGQRINVTLPIKPDYDDAGIYNNFLRHIRSNTGSQVNGVVSYNMTGKNVAQGGPVASGQI